MLFIIQQPSALKNRIISFFEIVTSLSMLQPEDIVFLDDTQTNITAAIQAGWQAIHWTENSCLTSEIASL